MKVFISGPMSGLKDFNKQAFDKSEEILRAAGYDVFNPSWMKYGTEWSHEEMLAIDIMALSKCDAIYQLPGWEKSRGASIENDFARAMRKIYLRLDAKGVITRGH